MLFAFLYLRMSILPVWNPFLLLLVLGSISHSLYWTHPNTLGLMRLLFPFFFSETLTFCVLRLSSNLPSLFPLSPSYEGWHYWHVPPHLAYLVLLDPQNKAGWVSQHLWLWVLELCPQITIAIHVWFSLALLWVLRWFCVVQLFVLKIQHSLYHCMGSPFSVSSLTEMGLIPQSGPNSWRGSHSLPFGNWAHEATSDNNLFLSLLMTG